jgi:hypothetical protein
MRVMARLTGAAVVALTVVWSGTAVASAGTYSVTACEGNPASIFTQGSAGGGMGTSEDCAAGGLGLELTAQGAINGSVAKWSTTTPDPTIRIVGVTTSGLVDCNLHADGFNASYFWGDNGVNYGLPQITVDCHGLTGDEDAAPLSQLIASSRYFGFQAACTKASDCTVSGFNHLVVGRESVNLLAQETNGPAMTPTGPAVPSVPLQTNLADVSGWVRGSFPAGFSASDPSGVCQMSTTVNATEIASYVDPGRDDSNWTQCHGTALPQTIDTTSYANGTGTLQLQYAASNAAGVTSTIARSINVDNVTPSVSLSVPADTSTAAGTQDVVATATGGPSGISAIYCSVDGASTQTYRGSTTEIPVAGLGGHQVQCYARDNAVDASGATAVSPTSTLDLSIRQPAASAITFARIADALQCHTATHTVKVEGRIHTVRRHGKRVRVRERARTVRTRVRQCHARTVVRTVRVVLKRHGKPVLRHGKPVLVKRRVRRVLLPHAVNDPLRRVRHGRATTVNGFVGLADGTAITGQAVDVYSSPNDNAPRFRLMRTVATDASGEWTAKVGAGPSRLIEAVYPGNGTTEPATSSTVKLMVPARIAVSISPRVLPWSGKIAISGRLVGGWVPRDGVALRLRVPYPGGQSVQEPFRTNSRGAFKFDWSYGSGRGVVSYRFVVATTATESDYPWAAAVSRGIRVTFGRPTPRARRHHRHRHG